MYNRKQLHQENNKNSNNNKQELASVDVGLVVDIYQ